MSDSLVGVPLDRSGKERLEYAKERTVHLTFEAVGVAVAVAVVVVVYGGLWAWGGPLSRGGCGGVVRLVHHAVGSIIVNFLTIDALLAAFAMVVSRSLLARMLYEYVCKTLLRLFIHSCAFSLGVGLGYLVLIGFGVTPRVELISVVRFCVAIACGAVFVVPIYFVMELVQLKDLDKAASKILEKAIPSIGANEIKRRQLSEVSVSVAGFVVGCILMVSAFKQLPTDFSIMQHSDSQSNEALKCSG